MSIKACIHDGWMLLRNFNNLDKMFAYYLLLHEREKLVQQGNGSVFTNLKTDILKNHVVLLPPLHEQLAIAGILSALDDKVELNRRMNATLETLARAVFRSWFIDFEPVRAKVDGSQPAGMNQETAALFPNKFKNTEIGDTPLSWDIASVEEVAERVAMGPFGSSIKVETFVDEGIPIISRSRKSQMSVARNNISQVK